MRLSERVKNLQSSMTLSIRSKAAANENKNEKTFNLASGDPYFTTPRPIIEYAMKMAEGGKTHYTPSSGLLELRELISDKLKNENKIECSSDNIIITPSKTAVNMALYAISDLGDEILIPEPYYVSYPEMATLNGLKPVFAKLDNNFDFDFEVLEASLTVKTKAILLSNPSNPTGKVYSEKSLRLLYDFAMEHDLMLITDDIYEKFVYEGKHFSIASINGSDDHVVTVGGFSKCFSMTGWRVGYLVGNEEFITQVNKIQQHLITCAPSISQHAAVYALKHKDLIQQFYEEFHKRRTMVNNILKKCSVLKYTMPDGGFYYFPSIGETINNVGFANELLAKKNVSVTPGIAFGQSYGNHFRLSFVAASYDDVKTGTERIVDFIEKKTN
ncbi:MAG: pyridoxal phosphate-dependent aminotransferase [Thermoplasmatales archaeon]